MCDCFTNGWTHQQRSFFKDNQDNKTTTMRYILDLRTRWTLDGEDLLNDLQGDSKIGSKKQ